MLRSMILATVLGSGSWARAQPVEPPAEPDASSESAESDGLDSNAVDAESESDSEGESDSSIPAEDRTAAEDQTANDNEASAESTPATPKDTSAPTRGSTRASKDSPEVIEVQGQSIGRSLEDSAKAVTVINTQRDRKKAADLGEVLARSQGISVRRAGGLGSASQFSINGLTDDQIRFFLDGIPLELAGFPFGIANVPVNLIDSIEVYRGVVPIEFGADALGGAVNLVSTYTDGTTANASYLVGSFGTHQATGEVQVFDDDTGWLIRTTGFFDYTNNDYNVDVEVPDEQGRLSPANVERFHDGYQAWGATVEVGVLEQAWADRLTLKAFASDFDRDIQNNVIMSIPYGEPRFFESTVGATLRYDQPLSDRFDFDVVAGYTRQRTRFLDRGECVYSWFGDCIRDRNVPGEIEAPASDQVIWDDNLYARVNGALELGAYHELRLSVSPTYTERTGDERLQGDPDARDPLTADRRILSVVSGVEYETKLVGGRLSNIAFVKGYLQATRSEEPLPGGALRRRDRDTERLGFGNSLRFEVSEWLAVKASYEWATRLPRVEEVFGDGVLIVDNLELVPETSHNVNLGADLDLTTNVGQFSLDVNGFLRESEDLIVLLGNDTFFSYQNVFGARSVGVEGALQWTSPGDYLTLGGNGTYLDFRNTASEGAFGAFDGDRIPNRPYLFANGFARLEFSDVTRDDDSIALDWNTRFVGEFFRGWESVGLQEFKQTVDRQLFHTTALIYTLAFWPTQLSFTAEVQNLTNARVFDFFGVQRPGRAFFFKTTAEL